MTFHRTGFKLDLSQVRETLVNHPEYFGKYDHRRGADSPHRESTDIWVRYADIEKAISTGDFSEFNSEHEPVWYEVADKIPGIKDLCETFVDSVGGSKLGGVLITKIPPGGKIHPHTDSGWHARNHRKYYCPVLNEKGAKFCFESGEIEPEYGDVWEFDNSKLHWVCNDSDCDRISLIICVRI